MHDLLKAICEANGFVFNYGRKDFHNLKDFQEQKNVSHVFLDPVVIKDNDNDSGETESQVHSGNFMILFSSDIDEKSYEDRYEKYIKPIVDDNLRDIKDELQCEQDLTIDLWQTTEVINVFDYNYDGVIVTFQSTLRDWEKERSAKYVLVFVVTNEDCDMIEGASVTCGGDTILTSDKGVALFKLQGGEYDYNVRKAGEYNTVTGSVIVDSDGELVNVEMEVITYNLTFTVKDDNGIAIENASVVIGTEEKLTDVNGEVVFVVKNGSYSYDITKEDFDDYSGVAVVNGGDSNVNIELIRSVIPVDLIELRVDTATPSQRVFTDLDINEVDTWADGETPYVASWEDVSGNNNDAVQSTSSIQPTYDSVDKATVGDGLNPTGAHLLFDNTFTLSTEDEWALEFYVKLTGLGTHLASAYNSRFHVHTAGYPGFAFTDGESNYHQTPIVPTQEYVVIKYECDGSARITVSVDDDSQPKQYASGQAINIYGLMNVRGAGSSYTTLDGSMRSAKLTINGVIQFDFKLTE